MTPLVRFALPLSAILAMLGLVLMHNSEPVEEGQGYIVQVVEWDSLLATSASEVVSSSDIPDAFLAADESAEAQAVAAVVPHDADSTSTEAATAHILTRDGLLEALAASPWPRHLWPTVIDIAYCESRWHVEVVGDQGRSFGLLQVHAPAHPRLVRSFDLLDLRDNLAAGWIVYLEAGGFGPWSCFR